MVVGPTPGSLTHPPGDEDHLAAGPIRRLPDLVNHKAHGSQRSGHLVSMAEAQGGVRGQHGTIRLEDDGPTKRDQSPLTSSTSTHDCTPPTPGTMIRL